MGASKTMAAKNAAKARYLESLGEAERLVLPLVLHQRDQALKQSLQKNDGSAKTEQNSRGS
jgi:collagenase-like PrtC family protease